MRRALKPNAQGFDEIRIVTKPRFKDSEISGSEWRISAVIQIMRNGRVIHEEHSRNVETACAHAPYFLSKANDDGLAWYAGEDNVCDQEGCSNAATVAYQLKHGYENSTGRERNLHESGEYRLFCSAHQLRGDCGLDDADINYTPIPMPMC